MEDIFLAIQSRIAEKMPALSLVDEDYGQLETEEDTYPVTFPCVLIGNIDADWKDIGIGVQKAEATITVRLAIDCYDDTHMGSGTQEKIRERQIMSNELYKALQDFRCKNEMSRLIRIKSRDFSLPGGIKVYEKIFRFNYHDESARKDLP